MNKRIEKLQEKCPSSAENMIQCQTSFSSCLTNDIRQRKEENLKKQIYEAYLHSGRSLDEIIAFIEGRGDEIDWRIRAPKAFRVLFSGSSQTRKNEEVRGRTRKEIL